MKMQVNENKCMSVSNKSNNKLTIFQGMPKEFETSAQGRHILRKDFYTAQQKGTNWKGSICI